MRSVHPSCARGADGDPLRHRRRHRPQRDGDGHLSRLDAEERAQGLRQGLHRRHDLHARHAGSRHAARSRPSRHGDAVVRGLCHLGDQEHRARGHDHRFRQLPGRPGRLCAEHVLRAQGFTLHLDAGSQGQEGRRQRLRLRRRSRVAGQAQERRHRPAQGSDHRRGGLSQPGRRPARKAHRRRHPDPAVHERRDPQGRPARALHRRRRIRSRIP